MSILSIRSILYFVVLDEKEHYYTRTRVFVQEFASWRATEPMDFDRK